MDEFVVRELETPCVYHDPDFLSKDQADGYYEALKTLIPWEKTAKINRWVRLYQEAGGRSESDGNNNGNDTNTNTNTNSSANTNTNSSTNANNIAPAYAYKDAPISISNTNNNNNDQDNTIDPRDDLTNVNGFPEIVQTLRQLCQDWYKSKHNDDDDDDDINVPAFNVCLLNFYEDGHQRIGWHADREEIGRTTPIASVSLGAPRRFLVRSQTDGRRDRACLELQSGSLVVMDPVCQTRYLHSVPKESDVLEGRINLTFRCKDFFSSKEAAAAATTQGEEIHETRNTFLDNIIKEGTVPTTSAWTTSRTSSAGVGVGAEHPLLSSSSLSSSIVFGDEPHRDHREDIDRDRDDMATTSDLCFLVKTNMGAEGYCAAEIREHLAELEENTSDWIVRTRPLEFDGYIGLFCRGDENEKSTSASASTAVAVRNALLTLKTAHHVLRYHHHFPLKDCFPYVHKYEPDADLETLREARIPKEALYEYVKDQLSVDAISVLPSGDDGNINGNDNGIDVQKLTFRVTSDRVGGPHAWQTPEVEYEIGGAIAEVYGDRHEWKPKMSDYDVHVRADVIGNLVVLATQINVHDLSKGRHFARYRNAVTIKTNLAYAMIRLANVKDGNTLLDPFCGSGTLLLEALEMHNGNLKNCLGMDVSRRSANGARANAVAEGYSDSSICRFVCSDARSLRRQVDADGSVDAVVTNLPWGIMTGQNQSVASLQTLYEVFLRNAWYVLKPRGRVVVLVLRGLQIMRIVRKLAGRFRLLHANVVRTTNNLPCIVVVEKLPDDVVRDSIKGQLAHLNQYVSVSPEIYKCIHTEDIDDDNNNNNNHHHPITAKKTTATTTTTKINK
eukprot:CAMPEP_0172361748 /NCGR_PEP_ID=MMETSP1060-20121228/5532_1 /TAXON_ID=37318 /ORGANISM="Pseudo-nitzschia pungens, Strain cf. cingulata" /LENGTH=842 /DNA_ID=CAMNT_0013084111 /DNA_START=136 /DNA_END=2664 /DNA_ORIENTATION=+